MIKIVESYLKDKTRPEKYTRSYKFSVSVSISIPVPIPVSIPVPIPIPVEKTGKKTKVFNPSVKVSNLQASSAKQILKKNQMAEVIVKVNKNS